MIFSGWLSMAIAFYPDARKGRPLAGRHAGAIEGTRERRNPHCMKSV